MFIIIVVYLIVQTLGSFRKKIKKEKDWHFFFMYTLLRKAINNK